VASIAQLVDAYDPTAPLERASTIPASWYLDERLFDLERRSVFARSWTVAGRTAQVSKPHDFMSDTTPAGEPIVVVRGDDDVVRSFFNVCRHHAAAVVTEPQGAASTFRCPYHGWSYALDGTLKGTPDFAGVCEFDRSANGLVPIPSGTWESWIFVAPDPATPLDMFLGADLAARTAPLGLAGMHWVERRRYLLDCNWKVFVDNYLDGGYHVPHLHKGLNSVLDYGSYTIENGARFCLQSSPLVTDGAEHTTGAVRSGNRAFYFWIYPNFMINCYGGAMDTNLVIPLGVSRTEVLFDFYFADVSEDRRTHNRDSIEVADRIQEEDLAICASVQGGLASRAYTAGRLSVRREAGEHLFHRLLHADLKSAL
jgi:choline monooxygenase